MKVMVMTEEIQGTQSYLSETQPKFHGENSILRSLQFSATQPYCSIRSTGSKQAEMGVTGVRELGRPMGVTGVRELERPMRVTGVRELERPMRVRELGRPMRVNWS